MNSPCLSIRSDRQLQRMSIYMCHIAHCRGCEQWCIILSPAPEYAWLGRVDHECMPVEKFWFKAFPFPTRKIPSEYRFLVTAKIFSKMSFKEEWFSVKLIVRKAIFRYSFGENDIQVDWKAYSVVQKYRKERRSVTETSVRDQQWTVDENEPSENEVFNWFLWKKMRWVKVTVFLLTSEACLLFVLHS
jgi:hypothetical protein